MDGLALLCNLCADGPVTLKRLRLAGVGSLAELERAAPPELAEWLHASVPQARGFVEEAQKLRRRLAEEQLSVVSLDSAASAVRRAPRSVPEPGAPALASAPPTSALEPLRAGLLPGLDEALCTRLALHHVRTLQALGELAGLALARRTGIPYSTLLELSRQARRFTIARTRESQTSVAPYTESEPVSVSEAASEAAAPAAAPAAPAAAPLAEPVPIEARELRPQVVQLRHVEPRQVEPRPERVDEGELREVELRPFEPRPRRAAHEREFTRSDEFTLPLVEPESAGPFG